MRIHISDDERSVRETLKSLVGIYFPECRVVGEASGVADSLKLIGEKNPDLLLLDIEMGDGTGFDLISKLGDHCPKVVFITAHNEYAVKAFRFSALDFLLKPIDPEDFKQAIRRAKMEISKENLRLQLKTLISYLGSERDNMQHIVLKDQDSIYRVDIIDIVRCRSDGNYTEFFLNDGRRIVVSKTLKEFENLLENHGFFRPHQSHLINLHHFMRYDKKEGGTIYMKDGTILPVAFRKKDRLFEALAGLS